MADFDYSELAATATELLSDFGRDVTLYKGSVTPVDNSQPWAAKQTDAVATDDVTLTARAVFVAPSQEDRAARTATATLRRVFIAASSLGSQVLDTTWRLVDGTTVYELLRVAPVQPGPTLLLYDALAQV